MNFCLNQIVLSPLTPKMFLAANINDVIIIAFAIAMRACSTPIVN